MKTLKFWVLFVAVAALSCDASSQAPPPAPSPTEAAAPLPNTVIQALQQQVIVAPPLPLPPDTRSLAQLQQAACMGANHAWRCPNVKQVTTFAFPSSTAPPTSWSVPAWFVSPATGSDNNTCVTSGAPCKTKSEIAYRWGTHSPIINTTHVVITQLDNDTNGNDPGLYTPYFVNGGSLTNTASLPAATFTGTLLVVTVKAAASNQALRSTFTTTTGAVVANMLLVNATHSSRAFAQRNVGAGVWQISQPLAPYTAPALPTDTEVDTWTAGDAISGYVPISVDLAEVGGQTVEYAATPAGSEVIYQLTGYDPGPTANDPLVENAEQLFVVAESVIRRGYTVVGTRPQFNGLNSRISNTDFVGDLALQIQSGFVGGSFVGPILAGGIIGGTIPVLQGSQVKSDTILSGTFVTTKDCTLGQTFVDTGSVLASTQLTTAVAPIYGAGSISVTGELSYGTFNAVTSFPIAGGLVIGGVSTSAYSNLTTGGLTAIHLLTITAAHLDAAAGATGFGGLAYIPGVGSITTGATP